MIEINLLEQKKKLKAPVVLGIDIAKIPWRKIFVTYMIAIFPLSYIDEYFKGELKADQEEVNAMSVRYQKLRKEVRKNDNIKAQLLAFNEQIDRLKSRSAQVDKIIKAKTNPRYVLEKIARTTPDNVWFDSLEIDDSSEVMIEGGADSYTSIGEFIVNLNETPYFAKSLQLADSKTKEESYNGSVVRVERFKIKGIIKLYDPFVLGQ